MTYDDEGKEMSNVIRIDEARIKDHLGDLVYEQSRPTRQFPDLRQRHHINFSGKRAHRYREG